MSPASGTNSADLAAGCQVTLGGSAIDPTLAARIMEVRVETTTALPDVCILRLAEDADDKGTLKVIDDARLDLAKPVTVKLAKAIGGSPAEVFNGEITSIEAEFGSRPGGDPVLELVVTAHDKSHRMHSKTSTRTLRQTTVTDVARKMAGENGLSVGTLANLPSGAAEERHQVDETDWAFLSRLVTRAGGELDVAAGKLHIIDPAKSKGPVAELVYGETLERFRPRVSSLGQAATVNVRGWDVKKKAAIAKAGTPKASTTVQDSKVNGAVSGSKVLVATEPVSTDAEADAAAKAIAMRLGHERVQAEAIAQGDPLLLAGEYVKISGVGTRFGGTHRIVSAVHTFGVHGYKTRLVLGAGGRPLAQTLNGSRNGAGRGFADHLAIGIVTDNKDPDKLGRVKVKYPLLDPEVESGWARIAWEAAGKERGTVAIPHVNDEVAVAFEHGDVRRPVILGVLFNGVDTPGADLVKDSSSVAARYPRDLDVKTQKKTMFVAGEDITVTSEKGGLVVEAQKDVKQTAKTGTITIEATAGQIKATGKQGVEISASGPLKITSTAPVTVESNAALQLKGSVVQVQASGVLQLSGATVMIG
jgi:uncharacterized protein involved in type VI secretion and phage assembly